MRKIKEVLRLRLELGMCARDVARSCGVGCTTVLEYGNRAKAAGLTWPLKEEMTDAALEALLFPPPPPKDTDRPLPDCEHIREQLQRKGVTLALLCQEYKREHPAGYNYSRFVELYREWEGNHTYSMLQTHRPGEKLFVDFAGMTMNLKDPKTGVLSKVQIFVAAPGYSQFIYVRACLSQSTRDWLDCHVLAFQFFGGVCEVGGQERLVPACFAGTSGETLKPCAGRRQFSASNPCRRSAIRSCGSSRPILRRIRGPSRCAGPQLRLICGSQWIARLS